MVLITTKIRSRILRHQNATAKFRQPQFNVTHSRYCKYIYLLAQNLANSRFGSFILPNVIGGHPLPRNPLLKTPPPDEDGARSVNQAPSASIGKIDLPDRPGGGCHWWDL